MAIFDADYCARRSIISCRFTRRALDFIDPGFIAALNRPHELKVHVRGALRKGVTREEISEVFADLDKE